MISLENISLVAITDGEENECINAINFSSKNITFKSKLLFTPNIEFYDVNKEIEIIGISKIKNISEWGKFVIFELHKYIDSDFIILIHPDGFIVNPQSWSDDFLNYDFIGAPWKLPKDNFSYRDFFGNIIRVGNSVSIRSKRILKLPSEIGLKWENFDHDFPHEDGFLTVQNRHILQENGIKFPTLEVACRFGREATIPENKNSQPFTFHKWSGRNKDYPCFNKTKRRKKFYAKCKKAIRILLNKLIK